VGSAPTVTLIRRSGCSGNPRASRWSPSELQLCGARPDGSMRRPTRRRRRAAARPAPPASFHAPHLRPMAGAEGASLHGAPPFLGHESFRTTQRRAHLQPDSPKAVLGAWERMETPLTIAARRRLRPCPAWTGAKAFSASSPDEAGGEVVCTTREPAGLAVRAIPPAGPGPRGWEVLISRTTGGDASRGRRPSVLPARCHLGGPRIHCGDPGPSTMSSWRAGEPHRRPSSVRPFVCGRSRQVRVQRWLLPFEQE
jgi:hypothetical protein